MILEELKEKYFKKLLSLAEWKQILLPYTPDGRHLIETLEWFELGFKSECHFKSINTIYIELTEAPKDTYPENRTSVCLKTIIMGEFHAAYRMIDLAIYDGEFLTKE